MNLKDKDIDQVNSRGLTLEKIQQQVAIFDKGIPFMRLHAAATRENGILHFSQAVLTGLAALYDQRLEQESVLKFVPASGAATRMFKELFKFLESYDPALESLNSYTNHEKATAIRLFLIGLEKFPFYRIVMDAVRQRHVDFDRYAEGKKLFHFVEVMMSDAGLNFGNFPKGLLPFHEYEGSVSTAFEEHLYEAASHTKVGGVAKIHFTISERHLDSFQKEFNRIEDAITTATQCTFDISYSFQKAATDTIAVDQANVPFRDAAGKLVFRPGGHGALIENLNELEAGIVFVKNIDNVVVRKYQDEIAIYKKALAGKLLETQDEIFRILNLLDSKKPNSKEFEAIKQFMEATLNLPSPLHFDKFSEHNQIAYFKEALNRPIRVCGMVINEGEPGGGPFWVKQENGTIGLQIIETAQINKNDNRQRAILEEATHFNPVDIVCGLKNYKGEKFDLKQFVDYEAGFITDKTMNGRSLKALELPGLWNGAMSKWITLFVEVPLTTFNPVKTVNDLLKSAHQESLFASDFKEQQH